MPAFGVCENKANSKPISKSPSRASRAGRFGLSFAKQSQFPKGQMNANFFVTKDYEKEPRRWGSKNKPKQSRFGAISNVCPYI